MADFSQNSGPSETRWQGQFTVPRKIFFDNATFEQLDRDSWMNGLMREPFNPLIQ